MREVNDGLNTFLHEVPILYLFLSRHVPFSSAVGAIVEADLKQHTGALTGGDVAVEVGHLRAHFTHASGAGQRGNREKVRERGRQERL